MAIYSTATTDLIHTTSDYVSTLDYASTTATTTASTLCSTDSGFKITDWINITDHIKDSAVYAFPTPYLKDSWKIDYGTAQEYRNTFSSSSITAPSLYREITNYHTWIPLVTDTGLYRLADNSWTEREMTKEEEIKFRFRKNLSPAIQSRANPIRNIPENEKVAIETLREMITEEQLRKYLRYGFVLIKGKSGDTYQIFRNSSHTKVWRGGTLVREVCIRLTDSQIPMTDRVIAHMAMIEADEDAFHKTGNVYPMLRAA